MPNNPTCRTRGDSKYYRTDQPTILVAKDKRRHPTIHKRLRHISEDQGGPTCTLQIVTVKRGPDRPWKSIAMDCITDLLKSEGYDTKLVIIDRLTKMSHFIPCWKDQDARQFANLFMKAIVRLHGLPHDIITDRGTLCTSDLRKETTGKLGIERRLSMAFHPQTDGQTERINAILEQYLRAYINYQQDDWCGYLPLAEFAYNKGYQETIKSGPFFAKYGINPEYQRIGHLIQGKQVKPEEITQLHESLRNEMVAAQLRQK